MDRFRERLLDTKQLICRTCYVEDPQEMIIDVIDELTGKIVRLYDLIKPLSDLTTHIFSLGTIEKNCHECMFVQTGRGCPSPDNKNCKNFIPANHTNYNYINGKWYKKP